MKTKSQVYVVHTHKTSGGEYRYPWDALIDIPHYVTSAQGVASNPEFHEQFNLGACIVTTLEEDAE